MLCHTYIDCMRYLMEVVECNSHTAECFGKARPKFQRLFKVIDGFIKFFSIHVHQTQIIVTFYKLCIFVDRLLVPINSLIKFPLLKEFVSQLDHSFGMQPHYFIYNIERVQQIEFSTTRPGMLSKLYLI